MSYAVDEVWETDLEPGTWYRIVKADKPRIIAGYVFEPPGTYSAGRENDYRDVDGHKLGKGNDARKLAFDAAIRNSKEVTVT